LKAISRGIAADVELRALITGAAGFVARHLALELASSGWTVYGSNLPIPHDSSGTAPSGRSRIPRTDASFERLLEADVANAEAMRSVLDVAQPDALFHLAGVSSVAAAERDPPAAFLANSVGVVVTLHELNAWQKRTGRTVRCVVVGSAEQYGRHPVENMPLDESADQVPVTAYAASKCAQEIAALQMSRAYGLHVVCTRSFNHSGGGQRPDFLLPALVGRALDLKAHGGKVLPVGNTTPVRDYLHVEDVVRAYKLLVESGRPGEVYNVSSGVGLSVRDIALAVLERVGVDATLEPRHDLVRPVDIPALVGDSSRLSGTCGWKPARKFDDIIEDLILAASQ
jgi:GDP-4-dehydro-6-deoxy-D-mannose reductase